MDRRSETGKINIAAAQNSRRLIGVRNFLQKLKRFKQDPDLWQKVKDEFQKDGLELK